MKRYLAIAALLFFALPLVVYAAGTVTESCIVKGPNKNQMQIKWTFVSDATNPITQQDTTDSWCTEQLTQGWWISQATTWISSGAAPTNNYTLTLTDDDGVDLMGGALYSRSSSSTQHALPKVDTTNSLYGAVFVRSALTVTLSSTSASSAKNYLRVDLYR